MSETLSKSDWEKIQDCLGSIFQVRYEKGFEEGFREAEGTIIGELGEWLFRDCESCRDELALRLQRLVTSIETLQDGKNALNMFRAGADHLGYTVCLIGSARYHDMFREVEFREAVNGKIVLSPVFCRAARDERGKLNALHMRKIAFADEVLVINVGGYIGEDTSRELAYARSLDKVISFLEPEKEKS